MIGPFLLFIGLFLLYIAFTGAAEGRNKSAELLNALGVPSIQAGVQSTEQNFGNFLKQHLWDQLTNAVKSALPFGGASQSSGSNTSSATPTGGGQSSPSLWNVPIIGADGTPGTIQVVSSSAQGAYQNAYQAGNTPTGGPVAA